MASTEAAFAAAQQNTPLLTSSGSATSMCTEAESSAASNFISPPTPSSEASKSTCSAPPIEVEMMEDEEDDSSPMASPLPLLLPTQEPGSQVALGLEKLSAVEAASPASDLRLSSAAARKIMFDQVKKIFVSFGRIPSFCEFFHVLVTFLRPTIRLSQYI